MSDGVGKEVVITYSTDIASNATFSTDSNGRQMMLRRRGERPTYTIDETELVAQNYYPVNTRIVVRDEQQQLGVLTDRSQGGASLQDGVVELMLHRR